MTSSNPFDMYAVLTAQIKELTERKAELNDIIVKNLTDSEEDSVETPVGKFTITRLKSWSYTDKVKKLEEEYKAQKAKEESTGDAVFVEKPSLRFTPIKF